MKAGLKDLPFHLPISRIVYMVADPSAKRTKKRIALCYPSCVERKTSHEPTMLVGNSRELYLHPQPLEGASGVTSGKVCFNAKRKKTAKSCLLHFERKTRVCPSAPHSVYQAITFAQYYTPNSRDTWVVSGCRFRVRLLPYKLQNYSCLRQIYE